MKQTFCLHRRTSRTLINWLPKNCTLCRAHLSAENGAKRSLSLCNACQQSLPVMAVVCPACGLPFALHSRQADSHVSSHVDAGATVTNTITATGSLCGRCLQSPPHYDACYAAVPYVAPFNRLITRFKYSARLDHGRLLAGLLATRLLDSGALDVVPDCLLPVPLHWRRQWQRGYNQSALLARHLRSSLISSLPNSLSSPAELPSHKMLPLNTGLLRRTVHTDTQTQQRLKARQRNVKNAFAINSRQCMPRSIAIVDDVMTTGATVNEISRLLKANGAQRVVVWCVARTPAEY